MKKYILSLALVVGTLMFALPSSSKAADVSFWWHHHHHHHHHHW